MKHLMFDIYNTHTMLCSMSDVNETVNRIIKNLGLKAVMPPETLPYYYCPNPNDGGISAYCILDGGHITIHTFPFYDICYIDILFDDVNKDNALNLMKVIFDTEKIDYWYFDRDTEVCGGNFSPETDFGPHMLISGNKKLSIDEIYRFLDTIPEKVDMHPIMRPRVITNKIDDYDIISGITIIAESHIAVHSNIKTGKCYLDIYSCQFCDPEKLKNAAVELLGPDIKTELVSRGIKDASPTGFGFTLSDNGWRENI